MSIIQKLGFGSLGILGAILAFWATGFSLNIGHKATSQIRNQDIQYPIASSKEEIIDLINFMPSPIEIIIRFWGLEDTVKSSQINTKHQSVSPFSLGRQMFIVLRTVEKPEDFNTSLIVFESQAKTLGLDFKQMKEAVNETLLNREAMQPSQWIEHLLFAFAYELEDCVESPHGKYLPELMLGFIVEQTKSNLLVINHHPNDDFSRPIVDSFEGIKYFQNDQSEYLRANPDIKSSFGHLMNTYVKNGGLEITIEEYREENQHLVKPDIFDVISCHSPHSINDELYEAWYASHHFDQEDLKAIKTALEGLIRAYD